VVNLWLEPRAFQHHALLKSPNCESPISLLSRTTAGRFESQNSGRMMESVTCLFRVDVPYVAHDPRNIIILWDMKTGKRINLLHGHTVWINALAVTPDASGLISGPRDGEIRVWDVNNAELLFQTYHNEMGPGGPECALGKIMVLKNSSHFVTASRDTSLKVWSLQEVRTIARFTSDSPFVACAIAKEAGIIAASDELGNISILRFENPSSG
jgi:WD40 repeat protein